MQIALPHPGGQTRQLAPFILLSLLLHGVLLFVIRLPTKNFPVAQPHPMEVYFSTPPISDEARVSDKTRVPSKARSKKPDHQAKLLAPPPRSQKSPAVPPAAQPDAILPADTPPGF